MYPIVLNYTDEELIRHLEERHPAGLALKFSAAHRELASRRTWHVYHDFWLHKASPGGADHKHEGYLWTGWEREAVKGIPGWKQMIRCTCLHPPTHQADCPGKQGVVVIGEDNVGPSARQKLWAELDKLTSWLMSKKGTRTFTGTQQAEAGAFALALALLDNPSDPDIDAVRKEAMKRWKERGIA